MKRLLVTVLFAISFVFSFSQKPPMEFGEIPMEDMKLELYHLDSSAAAVILADYGEAYVSITYGGASLIFERHTRIKILKKDGLKWANVRIPLYHSGSVEESVSNLKASAYNLEGGKIVETKMEKDGVFKEKFNRNINHQKFTLSNVKEGSVIEYSYKVNSDFLSNFPNWQFQYSIPVRHTEYWALIPDIFVMEKYMQGYLSPTSYEIKNKQQAGTTTKAHHWIIKDVPAFKDEPFMTSESDYVSKINFALAYVNFVGQPSREIMGSWQKLNDRLLESDFFGSAITGSPFLKKKVEELVAGETDSTKKVKIIYNYVRETLEWSGYNDFEAYRLKDVFEKKKGTTGDINLALASMLEKAGISVEMVLLSTRDHGFIRQQYPMTRQFNYVVCAVKIDGKSILLDATEKYLPMGVLPERCLNGQGLMISKASHGWVNIETKTKARTVVSGDLLLDVNTDLKGTLSLLHDGYDACDMRKEYHTKGEVDYLNEAIGNRDSWEVVKTTFENLKEIEKPVKEKYELVISNHATVAGDIMYINPIIVGQLKQNPFTLEERMYPVDYGSLKEKVFMCKIILPEGYSVEELPQNKVIILPGGAARYTYSVTNIGNFINILSSFQINRSLFLQSEYPHLREFYNQVVAKQAEQIVLKKK